MYLRRQDQPPLRVRLDVGSVPQQGSITQVKGVLHEIGVVGASDVPRLPRRHDEHRPAHVVEIDNLTVDRIIAGSKIKGAGVDRVNC